MANFGETALNFVQVCIYAFLHARRAYPDEMFEQRLVYGIVTFVSRDAALTSYVDDSLKLALAWLMDGKLRYISARLVDSATNELVEKMDFEFIPGNENETLNADQFRSCLVRLAQTRVAAPVLSTVPQASPPTKVLKFVLLFLVDHTMSGPLAQDWILADDVAMSHQEGNHQIYPLITTDGPLNISVRIEGLRT